MMGWASVPVCSWCGFISRKRPQVLPFMNLVRAEFRQCTTFEQFWNCPEAAFIDRYCLQTLASPDECRLGAARGFRLSSGETLNERLQIVLRQNLPNYGSPQGAARIKPVCNARKLHCDAQRLKSQALRGFIAQRPVD